MQKTMRANSVPFKGTAPTIPSAEFANLDLEAEMMYCLSKVYPSPCLCILPLDVLNVYSQQFRVAVSAPVGCCPVDHSKCFE